MLRRKVVFPSHFVFPEWALVAGDKDKHVAFWNESFRRLRVLEDRRAKAWGVDEKEPSPKNFCRQLDFAFAGFPEFSLPDHYDSELAGRFARPNRVKLSIYPEANSGRCTVKGRQV